MNKLRTKYALTFLVFAAMVLTSLVNFPRGPLLHCYEGDVTYLAKQASYGLPFAFIQGNTSGDPCSLPIDQLNEKNALVGNTYRFSARALVADVAIISALTGLIYFVASKTLTPSNPHNPKRAHA